MPISKVAESHNFPNLLSFTFISLSFGSFVFLHVSDAFFLKSVYMTTDSHKPIFYKIFASWANYEGSIFLWTLIINFYLVLSGYLIPSKFKEIRSSAITVQNFLYMTFALFTLINGNPFERLNFIAIEGRGLNPMLQDIALSIHPPILYLGVLGFGVVFAISVASAFLCSDAKDWEYLIRFWVRFSLAFLTIGLALGSWWAYRELGWGGFWFWDPVENLGLIPWLSGVILLHASMLVRRGASHNFAFCFGIVTFCFSVSGSLFTRSGILSSVHAFSVDNESILCIFAILFFILLSGGFSIYLVQKYSAPNVKYKQDISFFVILFGIVSLCTILSIILMGTFYPILSDYFGNAGISVGAPYYNFMVGITSAIALLFLCFGYISDVKKIKFAFPVLVVLLGLSLFFYRGIYDLLVIVLMCFSVCSLCFAVYFIIRALYSGSIAKSSGMILAHGGVAVFILGALMSSCNYDEYNGSIKVGDTFFLGNVAVTAENAIFETSKQFESVKFIFCVKEGNRYMGKLISENRFYTVEKSWHTEVNLLSSFWADIYVAVLEADKNLMMIRAYKKPGMILIWSGYSACALGLVFAALFGLKKRLLKKNIEQSL